MMLHSERPATRRQGAARRPSMAYVNLRCSSCGRQGADVAKCGFCGSTCCVADARCYRAIFSNANSHWGFLGNTRLAPRDLGWDVTRRERRR